MSRKVIAVWDIGKTNGKLALADSQTGAVVADRTQAFPSLPGPPYSHLDADGHWSWLKQNLSELAKDLEVDGIVVTAHGACCTLVDDEQLVLPILDYEDLEPDECEEEYAPLRPAFSESLSPPLPGGLNYGRGLFWQSRRFPAEFASAKHILSYVQYWAWRLSGVMATECTTIGSHSDLWQPKHNKFSSLVTKLGWQSLFPPIRRADEILGSVTEQFAAETGINPKARVYCGIHDSNASLLPWLERPQPFTICSTGTWVINFGVGSSMDMLDPARDCASNVSMYGDPVASSRWMGGREYSSLIGETGQSATLGELNLVLADEKLLILPNQGGQGGPFLHLPLQPNEHITSVEPSLRETAASLYCALMIDVTFELIASSGDIIIEGSFTHNDLLTRIIATLRPEQNVHLSEDLTGTTAGALRLALPGLPPAHTRKVEPLADGDGLMKCRARWHKLANMPAT